MVLTGGVGLNPHFCHYLQQQLRQATLLHPPQLAGALGAVRVGQMENKLHSADVLVSNPRRFVPGSRLRHAPLRLERSSYPDFSVPAARTDDAGTEVRVHESVAAQQAGVPEGVLIGIDIGSTTTKYALINERREIIHKRYVTTQGKPVEVTQHLLEAEAPTGGQRLPHPQRLQRRGERLRVKDRIYLLDHVRRYL